MPTLSAVEFNRDVRPILSDTCFTCHGPDANSRKAGLRLDVEADARAIVGELLKRVTSTNPKRRMPPPHVARQLSSNEIAILRDWVKQGAPWQKHWSFLAPHRPSLPTVQGTSWPRGSLDTFVLARLEREGLIPSPHADRLTLLRRVTLDLTGLPPSLAELDAYLADSRPGAYERVVDRLLQSPRFGERMATRWLDAARYADTSGYQSDGERVMWRWRDWVIEAYNQNLAFDRFTIEQLAGDMLPNATLDQVIATGFNRNHRGNAEGGIVPEEYAVEYVADRAETTATVWLGLTMGCARCHDHKYDPVSQREFYRLFAFFNNIPERGKAIKIGNSPPYVASPNRWQKEQVAAVERRLSEARTRVAELTSRLSEEQARWEKRLERVRPLREEQLRTFSHGQVIPDLGAFGFFDPFSLEARVNPDRLTGTILSRMADEPRGEGYAVVLDQGRVQVNLVKRWLDDAIRVETEERLKPNEWRHLVVTYDGSRVADGVRVYLDGRPAKLRVLLDDLNQTFETKHPFRVGAGNGPDGRFRGQVCDVQIHGRDFTAEDAAVAAVGEDVNQLLRLAEHRRSPAQAAKLRRYYLAHHAPADIRQAHERVAGLEKQRRSLLDSIPTTMVMRELPRPRDTFVLQRGQYDRPGEKVAPGVPEVLSPWKNTPDRLGLALWLVADENPLTARVAVNRLWQMLFGQGLVRTVEDFGAQGEQPSHPELLDWLAVEFRESGWDVKHLLRLIVTSSTYRQSSRVNSESLKRDPDNRLLGRGPRVRLAAEMIRDQALAASGLLVERLGGKSVKPYQPDGLWRELADAEYVRDTGEALYRRGLYVFWKRTVAPPNLITFDAAGREACSVRESRTNTPLQALTLLNDITYVEAARVLAQRAMREADSPEGRLTTMFRLVLSRSPRPAELAVMLTGFERHRANFAADRVAASKVLRAGDAQVDAKLDPAELAALTAMASVVLNLDEAITKE